MHWTVQVNFIPAGIKEGNYRVIMAGEGVKQGEQKSILTSVTQQRARGVGQCDPIVACVISEIDSNIACRQWRPDISTDRIWLHLSDYLSCECIFVRVHVRSICFLVIARRDLSWFDSDHYFSSRPFVSETLRCTANVREKYDTSWMLINELKTWLESLGLCHSFSFRLISFKRRTSVGARCPSSSNWNGDWRWSVKRSFTAHSTA